MRRLAIALVLLSACGKGDQPPPPSSGAPNATTETGPRGATAPTPAPTPVATNEPSEAQRLFLSRCAMCHGETGAGNGPASANLDPKPRNYTDPAWQASVTDDDLKKIILQGGQAVGKSASMPGQPDLADRPEIVAELVAIIRGFAKK